MMTEHKPDVDDKTEAEAGERERSTIEFPYMDLDDAISVAKAIHETCGASVCQHDQLAAKLGLSMNSSGFRTRLATSRLFGITESAGGGVRLTGLGEAIVDPARDRAAKVAAFLNVPLYKEMHSIYLGKLLPSSSSAVERQMADIGVAQKQTGRARQAFERSATTAGFFGSGKNRLVKPAIAEETPPADPGKAKQPGGGGSAGTGGAGEVPGHLHLMVQGLLLKLPAPDTQWSITEQAKWLQTAAHMFGLLYQSNGRIKIEVEGGEGQG